MSKIALNGGIIGTAGLEQYTGFLNAEMFDQIVFLGMTVGAWGKLALLVSVIVIILMNLPKLVLNWIELYHKIKGN